MTTARIPAGPLKIVARNVDGPVVGRGTTRAAVVCPGTCPGVHYHLVGPPRPQGYLRRAPCGAVYVVLVAHDEQRAV